MVLLLLLLVLVLLVLVLLVLLVLLRLLRLLQWSLWSRPGRGLAGGVPQRSLVGTGLCHTATDATRQNGGRAGRPDCAVSGPIECPAWCDFSP